MFKLQGSVSITRMLVAMTHLHLQKIWIIKSATLGHRFCIFNSFHQSDTFVKYVFWVFIILTMILGFFSKIIFKVTIQVKICEGFEILLCLHPGKLAYHTYKDAGRRPRNFITPGRPGSINSASTLVPLLPRPPGGHVKQPSEHCTQRRFAS